MITAKVFMQKLCRRGASWEEPLSEDERTEWRKWVHELERLHDVRVPRCVKPSQNFTACRCQLHHFCDASARAYAAVSYLRMETGCGQIYCVFLIGKAQVAPLKVCTIPRMELTAAVLAAQLDQLIKRELPLDLSEPVFWSDSTAVLQSLQNSHKRFPVFVANRLPKIEDCSKPSQWRFVNSKANPADEATRGLSVKKLAHSSQWLTGPQFLWQVEKHWPKSPLPSKENPFVCSKIVNKQVVASDEATDRLIQRFSSLYRLKKATSWLLRYKLFLLRKLKRRLDTQLPKGELSVTKLQFAER